MTVDFQTKSVKAATKGQKQIAIDNVDTLNFYRNMVFAANAIYFLCLMVFSSLSGTEITLIIFAVAIYTASYQFMVYMAKAKYSDSGQVIDSGVDLNMEGGIAE